MNMNPDSEARRESARQADGKFGAQEHAEAIGGTDALSADDVSPRTPTEFFDGLEGHGFGYLGERRNFRSDAQELGVHDVEALISEADAVVMDAAQEAGLSDDELAQWADSKHGRWAGEILLYGDRDEPLNEYLPKPKPGSPAELMMKAREAVAAAEVKVREAELAMATASRLREQARAGLARADARLHGFSEQADQAPWYASRQFGPLTVSRFYGPQGEPTHTSLTMDEFAGLSGYDLQNGLVLSIQEAGREELLDRITFDSESGMMCAYGEPDDLMEIAEIASEAFLPQSSARTNQPDEKQIVENASKRFLSQTED